MMFIRVKECTVHFMNEGSLHTCKYYRISKCKRMHLVIMPYEDFVYSAEACNIMNLQDAVLEEHEINPTNITIPDTSIMSVYDNECNKMHELIP
jgi:hypothetical protein